MKLGIYHIFLQYKPLHRPENPSMSVSREKALRIFQGKFAGSDAISIYPFVARNAESLWDSAKAIMRLEELRDWDSLAKLTVRGNDDVALLALHALWKQRRWLEIKDVVTGASGIVAGQAIDMLIDDNKIDELHSIKKEGCHPTMMKTVEAGIRRIEEHVEERIRLRDIDGLLHIAKSKLGTLKRECELLGEEKDWDRFYESANDYGYEKIITRTVSKMDVEEILQLIEDLNTKDNGVQFVAKALYEHDDSEKAMAVLRAIRSNITKVKLLEGAIMYVLRAIQTRDKKKLIGIARGVEREFEAG